MASKPGLLLEQRDPNFLLTFFVTLESGLESIIEHSINDCHENIFHRLACKSYLPVCETLGNRLDKKYIAKLMLTKSSNSKSPLILSLSADEEVASFFWMICETGIAQDPVLASFFKVSIFILFLRVTIYLPLCILFPAKLWIIWKKIFFALLW